MGEWVISVAGVIMLGVLLEIVLPEGKTAKYVKGAFSLLVVFAIAAPLPKLLNKDLTASIDSSDIRVDSQFVQDTYNSYASRLEDAIEEYLGSLDIRAEAEVSVEEGQICEVRLYVESAEQAENAEEEVAGRLKIDRSRIHAQAK